MLPSSVDIGLLYGKVDAAQIWLYTFYWPLTWPGEQDGISDSDAQLAWLLGTRLPAVTDWDAFYNLTRPASHPELPAPPTEVYDSQMQVLEYSDSFKDGSPLAFTFALAGDM